MSELEGTSRLWKDLPACNRGRHVPAMTVAVCLRPLVTPRHLGTSNFKAVLPVAKASCKAVLPQDQLCCWGQSSVVAQVSGWLGRKRPIIAGKLDGGGSASAQQS